MEIDHIKIIKNIDVETEYLQKLVNRQNLTDAEVSLISKKIVTLDAEKDKILTDYLNK